MFTNISSSLEVNCWSFGLSVSYDANVIGPGYLSRITHKCKYDAQLIINWPHDIFVQQVCELEFGFCLPHD
jgi:hypothetical protein